ncbi:MAG: Hsp33 family molecular chaperone HslO [Bacteroidetes bacterium]|nr:Hsp33 family molecular chaperone HslO [Bacteroidota bacterium]
MKMSTNDLKHKLINADRLISVIAQSGRFRASTVRNNITAQTAQEKHKLSKLPADYLAKHLTSATLISSFLKGEERIILDSSGSVIEKVYTEAMPIGEVRGFIKLSNSIGTSEKSLLNGGFFKLSKILYDKGEPITGIIEIKSDNVEEIIEDYFLDSEQIPTYIKLDVGFDSDNKINSSSGIIVQSLPGTPIREMEEVRKKLKNSPSINELLKEESGLSLILKNLLPFDFDVTKTSRVDFFCRCSKENFISKLYTLPVGEIESMQSENHNELVCQFCNSHYYLDNNDFNKIIHDLSAKKN